MAIDENTKRGRTNHKEEEGSNWKEIALTCVIQGARLLASGIVSGAGLAVGHQLANKKFGTSNTLPDNVLALGRKSA